MILEHSEKEKRLFKTGGIFKENQFYSSDNMRDLPNNYKYININDLKQYIDVIFKQKTNELTIYESFKREIDKFRTDKNNKKVKIVK